MPARELTQDELLTEARERFGDDPTTWAFRCPNCGDVATAQDFKDAGGDPNRIGQECIGRWLGALTAPSNAEHTGRGCDWVAYGLIRGPWLVTLPDGKTVGSFPLAEVVASDG